MRNIAASRGLQIITEAHGIMRNIAASCGRSVIIDPREILLLCVCVGSSILVARMSDNCDPHWYCSLFVMNISLIYSCSLFVMNISLIYSCSKQF